jgi:hypothetical protein
VCPRRTRRSGCDAASTTAAAASSVGEGLVGRDREQPGELRIGGLVRQGRRGELPGQRHCVRRSALRLPDHRDPRQNSHPDDHGRDHGGEKAAASPLEGGQPVAREA